MRRRISPDNGRTWGPIETLFDGRARPASSSASRSVVLDNGDWLLPVFHCHGTPGEKWVGDHDTSAVRISTDRRPDLDGASRSPTAPAASI